MGPGATRWSQLSICCNSVSCVQMRVNIDAVGRILSCNVFHSWMRLDMIECSESGSLLFWETRIAMCATFSNPAMESRTDHLRICQQPMEKRV